jgi:ATP-binding cassette subfamily B protein
VKNPPAGLGSLRPPRDFFGIFRYGRRAVILVWSTNRWLTLLMVALTVASGMVPAGVAYVGARIVDAVVAAARGGSTEPTHIVGLVALEGALVAAIAAASRAQSFCQTLLKAQLGHRVNVMILKKALTLELSQFEDPELYDKLSRAHRDASSRPMGLVTRMFRLVQSGISLATYGALLAKFSPWAVVALVFAGLPAFVAEVSFSNASYRLIRRRSPESRLQAYLETLLCRDDFAKEVKLLSLGGRLLRRHQDIYEKLYRDDRALAARYDVLGFALSLVTTGTLYGAYAWIAINALRGHITLGAMTMYVTLFRQGQSTVSGGLSAVSGIYEDTLYLSMLYEYLDTPVTPLTGCAVHGPLHGDGIRFENVGFTYPGNDQPSLEHINLHLKPRASLALVGENGSGKTTLIKLLTRLYQPTSGRILLDGRDLNEWENTALLERIAVIFQDFTRYQMRVGENVGVGDDAFFDDEQRWREAAAKGRAHAFVETLPAGYHTQLGKWFRDGREISGGQWQKIALSRAFMRKRAEIIVLDEPTASLDAQAEAEVFDYVRQLARDCIVIVISHRFSTVRAADQIAVLDRGRIVECGRHEDLIQLDGSYAHLFALQARGYR